ncbi:hypothetical protein G6O69_24165 [Pseudenhygromyxa sp. WMMC2535]|uniref:hypothetical protein n=1 Tax=Pseudenhygromyxa sp. WMMC2535 TaxID=2712867 RepID=UPI001553C770|nr:hypothetical protein [Pseudenhygromyxa sp. WMMC2535]NVB40957.1 hypothetical protein [Pseudenhygromyxa sp. WMMC2535]
MLAAAGLSLTLVAASPETLPRRKLSVSYNAQVVKVGLVLSELLRESDRQAMKSLDSGWATRLVYDVAVFEKNGTRAPLAVTRIELKVQWDPWNRDYMVQTQVDGGKPTLRRFALRADAIAAATALRVSLAPLAMFKRGENHAYFASVFAQRNPIQTKAGAGADGARGQDRDLEVFSRWVGMFVRSRPKAEKTAEFRSQFFYVPED